MVRPSKGSSRHMRFWLVVLAMHQYPARRTRSDRPRALAGTSGVGISPRSIQRGSSRHSNPEATIGPCTLGVSNALQNGHGHCAARVLFLHKALVNGG